MQSTILKDEELRNLKIEDLDDPKDQITMIDFCVSKAYILIKDTLSQNFGGKDAMLCSLDVGHSLMLSLSLNAIGLLEKAREAARQKLGDEVESKFVKIRKQIDESTIKTVNIMFDKLEIGAVAIKAPKKESKG